MHSPIIGLPDDVGLAEVIDLMMREDLGSVVLVNSAQLPLGIITKKDIIHRVIARRSDPEKLKARDVMSTPVITVSEGAGIEEAVRLMVSNKIQHLVVISQNERSVSGMVSSTDLVKELSFLQWISPP